MPLPTWRAGEHMAVIGQTGSGKSVLMSNLLDKTRQTFIVLKSKADSTKYPGTVTVSSARAMDDPRRNRLVLRPRYEQQGAEFLAALDRAWRQGGWTVGVDELYYVDQELRLRLPVNRLLTQGRAPGRISMCCGMQRPSLVTRFAIGEATHVISFAVEGRDAKILADACNRRLADVAAALPRHHFAWFYMHNRSIWTGKLDMATGRLVGRNV